jgi:hypothetical protein
MRSLLLPTAMLLAVLPLAASAQSAITVPISMTVGGACVFTKPNDILIQTDAPMDPAQINFSANGSFSIQCPNGTPYTWTLDGGPSNLFYDSGSGLRIFRPTGLSGPGASAYVDNRRIGFEIRQQGTGTLITTPGQGAPIGGTGNGATQVIGFTLAATPATQRPEFVFANGDISEFQSGVYSWSSVMSVVITF